MRFNGQVNPSRELSPTVTVGVPVYNGEAYLAAALEALLGQTYDDFEIVVSDNGSTDGTAGIVREFMALDSRIRYERQPVNRGAVWNFNRLVELARGRYFKWAAHDDVCDPSFLERCVAVLERDPTVVCCHSRVRKIDAEGQVLDYLADPTAGSVGGASRHVARRFLDVLLSEGYAVRSFGVFRTSALRASAPLLAVYGSEKVLMGELALRGRFHDIEEVLFFERVCASASADLSTAVAQQHFIDPSRHTAPLAVRFQLLAGHLRSPVRARLSPIDAAATYGVVFIYLLQIRKWGRVLRSMLNGTGTRGGPHAPAAGPGVPDMGETRSRESEVRAVV